MPVNKTSEQRRRQEPSDQPLSISKTPAFLRTLIGATITDIQMKEQDGQIILQMKHSDRLSHQTATFEIKPESWSFHLNSQLEMDHNAGSFPFFSLLDHLTRQRAFSLEKFGPGRRTSGVLDHIEEEIKEIREKPQDLKEWVDLILLALDGAWRAGITEDDAGSNGYHPVDIVAAIEAKQTVNEGRRWPDWRTAPKDKAIKHVQVTEE